jgi:hypothetical protein
MIIFIYRFSMPDTVTGQLRLAQMRVPERGMIMTSANSTGIIIISKYQGALA